MGNATTISEQLPGAGLVSAGMRDLAAAEETVEAMAVAMAAPRLRAVGVEVPEVGIARPSHRLYRLLGEQFGGSAHSRYNALVGRIVSFARAAESARAG